ncbi:MAG TPA: hypothetical protein VMT52_06015 [Planctomycetota bacterium]|nr:hypothetical protein [Planctomycetota bacterium]
MTYRGLSVEGNVLPGRGLAMFARAALVVISGAWLASLLSAPEEYRFFVSSSTGVDSQGRGSSLDDPFRTIRFGLAEAPADSTRLSIRLAPGEYRDTGADAAEVFPIFIAPRWRSVEIEGSQAGPSVLKGTKYHLPLMDFAPAAGEVPVTVRIRHLELEGGAAGLCFAGIEAEGFDVAVTDCRFRAHGSAGIEARGRKGASVRLAVTECTFEGSRGGVSVLTAEDGIARVQVEACRFEALGKYGPGSVLGAGVDLHLDRRGRVEARIARNTFMGVASAVQLTAAEMDETGPLSGGTLAVEVVNNVVSGSSMEPSASEGVAHGIYLSLWPHHALTILVANNTFVGVHGHIIHHDNLARLVENGLQVPLVFVNNIAWRTGADSEFPGETAEADFPPPAMTIRNNLLEKSRLGADGAGGNFTGDPRFLDENGLDYRLSADSPAIDRGDAAAAGCVVASCVFTDEAGGATNPPIDLAGRCRRASQQCDLTSAPYPIDAGAHEHPGFCDVDVVPFQRGDCHPSGGAVVITDAVYIFGFLFLGHSTPPCLDACDGNDDGDVSITDGIYLLSYLFLGGPPPPAPFSGAQTSRGTDPTRDCLGPCEYPGR